MTSLYDILSVARDATPEQIKAAYRKASSSAHPDRNGGDTRKQQAINDAYAVLSDPERRSLYDSSGLTAIIEIDKIAETLLVAEIGKVIADERIEDPFAVIRMTFNAQISALDMQVQQMGTRVRVLNKRMKRIKRKDSVKGCFLTLSIEHGIRQVEQSIEQAKVRKSHFARAMEFVDLYEFDRSGEFGDVMSDSDLRFMGFNFSST